MRADSALLRKLAEAAKQPQLAREMASIPLIEITESWEEFNRPFKETSQELTRHHLSEFVWPFPKFGLCYKDEDGHMDVIYFLFQDEHTFEVLSWVDLDNPRNAIMWFCGSVIWKSIDDRVQFEGQAMAPTKQMQKFLKENPDNEYWRKALTLVVRTAIRRLYILYAYLLKCYESGRREVTVHHKKYQARKIKPSTPFYIKASGHVIYMRPPDQPRECTKHEGSGSHRRPHARRAHLRRLKHERYKNHPHYGKTIPVRATWIGDRDWQDAEGNTYRVLFD